MKIKISELPVPEIGVDGVEMTRASNQVNTK